MGFTGLILSFIGLMFIVCGAIIFGLHRALVSSTEGAVKRLNDEIAKATAKQNELTRKLKQADEELAKRQAEARELAQKMRREAEEASRAEREKIIQKARQEAEEIIAKAQGAKEKIRQELEKEFDIKLVRFSMKILNFILSHKAKGALDEALIDEFLASLQEVDMSRIGPEVTTVELISLRELDEKTKERFKRVIEEKLKREVSIKSVVDKELGGGVILKFGSMALDGSVKNLIREAGNILKQDIENG